MLYRHLYNKLALPTMWTVARLLSYFHGKVRLGWNGRRGLVDRVREFRERAGNRKVLLFHCASAGEIESIKPVATKLANEKVSIALSYFSPSAITALKHSNDFQFADYAPFDSPTEVRQYLDALRPKVVAIVKHDLWPNFVWVAKEKGIPVLLVNGNFHPRSRKQMPIARSFHRSIFVNLQEILAVSPEDAERAKRIAGSQVAISAPGDSRFDRVAARAAENRALPPGLSRLCAERRVFIAGSTHAEDEELIIPALPIVRKKISNLLTIIVPHDPSDKAATRILTLVSRVGLRGVPLDDEGTPIESDVVLVNQSGILADLYRLGQVAFVGGGFGRGVHSVLEPMVFGLPVICGPNIHVSHEAGLACRKGILYVARGRRRFAEQLVSWLPPTETQYELHDQVRRFVNQHVGASDRISARIRDFLNA